MRKSFIVLVGLTVLAAQPVSLAYTEEDGQTCPVDTTKDSTTGKPRSGVQICGGNGSASVGASVSGDEVKHFLKYPIGQSDKSMAKQIGNTVHNFFHRL